MSLQPKILVHGGAWDIPSYLIDAHVSGTARARKAAEESLARGFSPLDAIVAALTILENDPTFDAGTGSFLNECGEVECDAGIMEGEHLKAGAVAGLSSFANPSHIALAVLRRTEHVLLMGVGAETFALSEGFEKVPPQSLIHPREQKAFENWIKAGKPEAKTFFSRPESESLAGMNPDKRGTVGVVIGIPKGDGKLELFSGISTGGTPGKKAGRVGDVPLTGCGFYADNEGAAVSCTGWGEGLIRVVAAKTVSELVKFGEHPQQAIEKTLATMLRRTGGRGGIIAIDSKGRMGAGYTTPEMAFAGECMCEKICV